MWFDKNLNSDSIKLIEQSDILEVRFSVMELETIIAFLVTISIALTGYLFTYFNNLRLTQRKDRLERINRQLKEFYGPLFAIDQASTISFKAFLGRYGQDGRNTLWTDKPTKEDLLAWQLWITEVLMPLNVQMQKVIIENADLLDEPEMPKCLVTFCAHVSGYKANIKRWEEGDFSYWWSVVRYPGEELHEYLRNTFLRLKTEQAEFLGISK